MSRSSLPASPFELYYLAELTCQKLKPLSRWEKPTSRQTPQMVKETRSFCGYGSSQVAHWKKNI